MMLILSVLFGRNDNKSFLFGFPFIWLEFFHLGQRVEMNDLLNFSKYLIKFDFLLIDLFLNYLAIQFISKLVFMIIKKHKTDTKEKE